MANNYTTSSSRTTENNPLSSSPVWIVPENSTSTSDKSILLSNNNTTLPTYNSFSAPSAPEIDDEPPNYFDISIVPSGAVLYNNEITPYSEGSKAEIERDMKGVLSYDLLIDKNPDQLWLYFMTYLNEKPQLKVNICGSYTESYTTTESYTDSDGNNQTRDVQQTRTVTEFNFSVDLSPYICEQWWRVAVIPSAEAVNAGEIVSLRDALEQYTRSNRKIKEIILKKQFHGWNLQDLQSKLIELVRSTGYGNSIAVTFSTYNYKITARSSSQLSVFANSGIVRVICCLTCLWIIFAPIYCCLRALGSPRDKIIAEYVMTKSSDTFLQLNSPMIVNAVKTRSFNSCIAYFA